MALENETEQLAQAMNVLRESLQSGGIAATKFGQQLTTSQKFVKELDKGLTDATKSIANGMLGFAGELAKGDSSLTTMNKVVDVAADAMGAVAKAVPVFGDAIAGALKAAAEGAKVLIGQLDATQKSFNVLSSVGATTAKGMSDIKDQQIRSGLSLQQFQKVVMDNSQTLARFNGLTGEGAESFSRVLEQVTGLGDGSDQTLRKLGLSADQISSSAGAFLTQQTRLGRSQMMSNEQLAQGTIGYVRELDLLSKVTGQSRESLQKQQDAALSETRFRAQYQDMVNNGNGAAAKELMKFQSTISSVSKDAGQGIRDLSSGIVDSAAAQGLMTATNGKALDIQQRLTAGQITGAQATEELQQAIKENENTLIQQGKYNKDYGATFSDLAGLLDLTGTKFDQNGKIVEQAAAAQKKQITQTDQLTLDTIEAQKSIEGLTRQFDALTYSVMPYTARYTKAVAEAMQKLLKATNDAIEDKGGDTGEAVGGQAGAIAGAVSMGVSGAILGSFLPGIGTAVGGAIGGVIGGIAGYTGMVDYGKTANKAVGMGGAATGLSTGKGRGGAPGGGSATGSGGNVQPTSQSDLKGMGLNIKAGDVQKEGAGIDPRLIEMAKEIQSTVPGFAYFSGFNDKFHNENAGNSQHTKGLAMDFALQSKPSKEQGAGIVKYLQSLGASLAIDEYNSPSAKATGGHIHAQISARDGFSGVISGPSGGYQPNLTMHGTEALTVTPTTNTAAMPNSSASEMATSLLSAQLSKLDELVSVMKNQVTASERLIRMQS